MSDLQHLIDAERQVGAPGAEVASRRWVDVVRRVHEGVGPSVPVSTAGLPELGAKAGSSLAAKLLLLATIAGGGAAVAAVATGGDEEPAAVTAVAKQSDQAPEPEPKPESEPVDAASALPRAVEPTVVPPASTVDAPAARPPVRHKPRAAPAAPSPAAPAGQLGDEAKLLGEAWRSLDAGSLGAAAIRLARHRREFPDGQLSHERRAAEAVLRCRSGHDDAGAKFLASEPGSIYAARVTTACEKKESHTP